MSGGLGEPGPRVAVSGGQGVQVGDHNTQVNYIGAPGFVVPVTVAVKDPEPVFAAAGIDRFTGREWLAGEVDRFIAEHPCGYVFIEAEAGLGKTAFAAWLVKTRGYLSHFSRYSGGQSALAALQNLSAQLVMRFGLNDQAPGGMLPVDRPGNLGGSDSWEDAGSWRHSGSTQMSCANAR